MATAPRRASSRGRRPSTESVSASGAGACVRVHALARDLAALVRGPRRAAACSNGRDDEPGTRRGEGGVQDLAGRKVAAGRTAEVRVRLMDQLEDQWIGQVLLQQREP